MLPVVTEGLDAAAQLEQLRLVATQCYQRITFDPIFLTHWSQVRVLPGVQIVAHLVAHLAHLKAHLLLGRTAICPRQPSTVPSLRGSYFGSSTAPIWILPCCDDSRCTGLSS